MLTAASGTDRRSALPRQRTGRARAALSGSRISANPKFYQDGAQLAALALEAGLPTCEWAEMARIGCANVRKQCYIPPTVQAADKPEISVGSAVCRAATRYSYPLCRA